MDELSFYSALCFYFTEDPFPFIPHPYRAPAVGQAPCYALYESTGMIRAEMVSAHGLPGRKNQPTQMVTDCDTSHGDCEQAERTRATRALR